MLLLANGFFFQFYYKPFDIFTPSSPTSHIKTKIIYARNTVIGYTNMYATGKIHLFIDSNITRNNLKIQHIF